MEPMAQNGFNIEPSGSSNAKSVVFALFGVNLMSVSPTVLKIQHIGLFPYGN